MALALKDKENSHDYALLLSIDTLVLHQDASIQDHPLELQLGTLALKYEADSHHYYPLENSTSSHNVALQDVASSPTRHNSFRRLARKTTKMS